jgi:hypothetical protein
MATTAPSSSCEGTPGAASLAKGALSSVIGSWRARSWSPSVVGTGFVGLAVQLLFVAGDGVWPTAKASAQADTIIYDYGPTAVASSRVSLSGRIHIIWNGGTRIMLVDDQGMATRLVVDETLLRAFGGARGLNQKRVTITGERAENVPTVVRVLSIELEGDQ